MTFGPQLAGGGYVVFASGLSATVLDPATGRSAPAAGTPVPFDAISATQVSGAGAAWLAGSIVQTAAVTGGPVTALPAVDGCPGDESDLTLLGDTLAYVSSGCGGAATQRIVLDRLGVDPAPRVIASGEGLRSVSLAGDLIGWVGRGTDGRDAAVVARQADGAALYVVPPAESISVPDFRVLTSGRGVITTVGIGGSPLISSVGLDGRIGTGIAAGTVLAASGERVLVDFGRTASGSALDVVGVDGSFTEVAQFDARARRVGDADLEGTGVTWAQAEAARPAVKARKRPCSARQRRAKRCPKPIPGRAAVPARTVVLRANVP